MQQWVVIRPRFKVAGVSREEDVARNGVHQAIDLPNQLNSPGSSTNHPNTKHAARISRSAGHNAPHPALIEPPEAESPVVQTEQNELSDQVAGDDEEHVDADERAR